MHKIPLVSGLEYQRCLTRSLLRQSLGTKFAVFIGAHPLGFLPVREIIHSSEQRKPNQIAFTAALLFIPPVGERFPLWRCCN